MSNAIFRPHRRPTIGVLPGWQVYEGNIPHSFLLPIFSGIRAAAHDLDCNVLFACGVVRYSLGAGNTRPAWPLALPDSDFVPLGPWNSDGLIVINPLLSAERSHYVQALRASGFPVLFISAGESGPTVVADNAGGIHQALDHLAWHGHRRIAFIAGLPVAGEDSALRLQAYRQWMGEHALAVDEGLIAYGYHNQPGGKQAIEKILASGAEFSAVLASNDESAIGAIHTLQAVGRRVPEDVAVIGFDNRLEAVAQNPPLTTIQYPAFEMGYTALQRLAQKNGLSANASWVRTPTRLVIRQSCGCQPGMVENPGPATRIPLSASPTDWAQALSDALTLDTGSAMQQPLHQASLELVEHMRRSLVEGDLVALLDGLSRLFAALDGLDDGQDSGTTVIATLEQFLPAILSALASKPQQATRIPEALRTARLFIYQHERARTSRMGVQQMQRNDQIGRMMESLHSARDEEQVLEALVECLPTLGIRFGMVNFYEPGGTQAGDDAYTASRVRACYPPVPLPRGSSFRNREFSFGELLGEPYQYALLPMRIQERLAGFVAFDAEQFELYALIVWQLETAFENARLYRQAAEARQLAEEADRLKGRFLSTVSHELRTPLSLIVGQSELLLQQTPGGSTRQAVERIYANAQHLGWLIRDVLDLASSQAGQLRLACETLNLAETLSPVAQTGELLAAEKGLIWRYEAPTQPVWAWGDRTRLRQVALNLVSNAVKFTEHGQVTLRLTVEAGQAVVSVHDTGLGIPLAEQALIFDEFRQSERTNGRGYGGLGLGLAISKRLVELHDGSMAVQSSGEEGGGSTFTFRLPLFAALPPLPDAPPSPQPIWLLEYVTKPIGSSELARALERFVRPEGNADEAKTILIVDDEPALLEMHAQIVQATFPTLRVLRAQQGRQALALLREHHVNLVLLDLMMPELDGLGVLKEMRANPLMRDIPVLVLTAQVLSETDMAQLSQGVNRVLEKGVFSAEEVVAHIATALEHKRNPGAEAQRLARQAMAYIHQNHAEHITRESIASHIGVSEDYLARCFQQETGLSLMTYLTRYRINRAKSLLSVGALSVTQVALEVGFVSESHFSRVFRQEVGVSPGAYRRGKRI